MVDQKSTLKIFIDTNIAFDFIANRHPFYDNAQKILTLLTDNNSTILISDSIVTTLIYLCEQYKIENRNLKLQLFFDLCDFLCSTKEVANQALNSSFDDKEDALQYFTALSNQCDYFITRNIKDYKAYSIPELPVLTPEEFLNLIEEE